MACRAASAARIDLPGHSYGGPAFLEDLRAVLEDKSVDERLHKTLERENGRLVLKRVPVFASE